MLRSSISLLLRMTWLLLLLPWWLTLQVQSKTARGIQRKIQILNDAQVLFQVYWVHPETRETVLMSDPHVVPGAEFPLDSFVGHEFEIREVPGKGGLCWQGGPCRSTTFAVSENDDQLATVTTDFETVFVDNKIKAKQEAGTLISQCQASARKMMEQAGSDANQAAQALDHLVQCVQGGVAETLERVHEEIAFQATVRKDIAGMLENYTCLDDALNSTEDLDQKSWHNPRDGIIYTVHVKHERPASRIHVIENFIRPDECAAMEAAAAKTLHRATVADGKGGSQVSLNRKAMQAGITVPWAREPSDDPIARVSRRVYDYTNHVLNLNIQEFGQEDLMSIQYFGRGVNDTEPDRYTPHCDGDCTGLPHKSGSRMATMVMYCTMPQKGGHTNFRNAGVHVKPEPYAGIFFAYIDPQTKVMDTGFTEHSGCPVFEGEKKIVTQWIRLGVDHENPWDSFNTLGVKIRDIPQADEEEEYSEEEEEVEEEDVQEIEVDAAADTLTMDPNMITTSDVGAN